MVFDPDRPDSVGRAVDGSVRITDAQGRSVAPDTAGEVWLSCPHPRRYHRDAAANRDTFRDRWVRMGDLGAAGRAGLPVPARPTGRRHQVGRGQRFPRSRSRPPCTSIRTSSTRPWSGYRTRCWARPRGGGGDPAHARRDVGPARVAPVPVPAARYPRVTHSDRRAGAIATQRWRQGGQGEVLALIAEPAKATMDGAIDGRTGT